MASTEGLLIACLQRSLGHNEHNELIRDIMTNCDAHGITAKAIAANGQKPADVAKRLFLTESEAGRLINECTIAMNAAASPDALISVAEENEEDADLFAEDAPENLLSPNPAGAFTTPPDSPTSRPAAAKGLTICLGMGDMDVSDIPLTQPNEVAVKLVRAVNASLKAGVPKAAPEVPPQTPSAPAPTPSAPMPTLMPAPKPAAPTPTKPAAAPSPKPTAAFAANNALRTSCPSVILPAKASKSSGGGVFRAALADLPSYLRPTAAAQARSKYAPEPTKEEPVKKSESKNKKYRAVLAKVFAPTAAFLARITGRESDKQAAGGMSRSAVFNGQASLVDSILLQPKGKRHTEAKPFSWTKLTGSLSSKPLTTEEAAMLEAEANKFKPNAVPKHVHEARPIDTHVASTPKRPEEIFEPFNLASEERHAAALAKKAAERAAEEKEEEERRIFKAKALDMNMIEKVCTPRKPEPKPATVAAPPRLSVDERSKHWEEVVTPARRARMELAQKLKQETLERKLAADAALRAEQELKDKEEKARAEALERMQVKELRRSLVFHAREMPDPDHVFRPDMSRAPKVTQSCEFRFATVERLGKPLSSFRQADNASPTLLSRSGCYDAFSSSLRSSVIERPKPLFSPRSSLRNPLPPPPSAMARRIARMSKSTELTSEQLNSSSMWRSARESPRISHW